MNARITLDPRGQLAPDGPEAQKALEGRAGTYQLLSTTPVSGLVLVGGDTAHTVFRALRASGLVLVGEVAPGVPYGRLLDGRFAGLPTATKAGGFGADTVLADSLKFLQRWTGQ